jgi:arsenical pump membrane protein
VEVDVAALEAILVAALTLAAVVTRPRGLNEGVAALLGAALVVLLRLVPPGQALSVEWSNWNVFLFFLGMMAVAALADQSGVFDRVAALAARLAVGRVFLLYLAVFLLGGVISVLFANDSAALVLTPIVYALVLRLSLDPFPFVFATTFVADTASLALPVSNPLNVIVAGSFGISLGSYVSRLWLPAVIVFLINVAVFLALFRRGIRGRFGSLPPPQPAPAVGSSALLLTLLAAAYLAASAEGFPLGIVAVVGAAVMAVNLFIRGRLATRRLAREVSYPIFGFIAGMIVLVQALNDTGVTAHLGKALVAAGVSSHLAAIAVSVAGTALGANLINNLPMALVMTATIHPLHVSGAVRSDLIYGTIAGCDLGPNLTHLGSLATLIWLFFLRRKGVDVSTWDYFRIGLAVTPLMLAGAVLGLWLTAL